MCAEQDNESETWRKVARAAGIVADRYGLTLDEAMHVLRFEASLFRLPLSKLADLALSARPPETADDPHARSATQRAAQRWGRPSSDR